MWAPFPCSRPIISEFDAFKFAAKAFGKNTLAVFQIGHRVMFVPKKCVLINMASVVDVFSPLQLKARQKPNLDLKFPASLDFNITVSLTVSFWDTLRILVFGQRLAIHPDSDIDLVDHWHGESRVIIEIDGR